MIDEQQIDKLIETERSLIMSQSGGNNTMVFVTAMTVGVVIILVALTLSGVFGN